jgi:hypothetical protein
MVIVWAGLLDLSAAYNGKGKVDQYVCSIVMLPDI